MPHACRSVTKPFLKSSPDGVGAAKTALIRDVIDASVALFNQTTGRIQPQPLHKGGRGFTKLLAEDAGEIARAHSDPGREHFNAQICAQVLQNKHWYLAQR